MKDYFTKFCLLPLLAMLPGVASAAAVDKPASRTAPTAVVAPVLPTNLTPQSVFKIPSGPKEGRNPFFPRSKTEPTVVVHKPNTIEPTSFVLNGITSPPKRTAMINGRTFEAGETGDVKLQNGDKISIQVVEIRDNGATILVGTQRHELRMRGAI